MTRVTTALANKADNRVMARVNKVTTVPALANKADNRSMAWINKMTVPAITALVSKADNKSMVRVSKADSKSMVRVNRTITVLPMMALVNRATVLVIEVAMDLDNKVMALDNKTTIALAASKVMALANRVTVLANKVTIPLVNKMTPTVQVEELPNINLKNNNMEVVMTARDLEIKANMVRGIKEVMTTEGWF
jgi:hypothetical protein